ncbi:MAG: hypothetical protein EZS28_005534 [Streblomastix strix]|uniref:Uncharacterized protein n=1 Tax=Streblomastix strix TaxID=222440 RepID=A0A5J4WX64_9EUKA|nr:MAG: hypothetical protein EZS28_005534 [Streblomastix strix]
MMCRPFFDAWRKYTKAARIERKKQLPLLLKQWRKHSHALRKTRQIVIKVNISLSPMKIFLTWKARAMKKANQKKKVWRLRKHGFDAQAKQYKDILPCWDKFYVEKEELDNEKRELKKFKGEIGQFKYSDLSIQRDKLCQSGYYFIGIFDHYAEGYYDYGLIMQGQDKGYKEQN